MSVFAALAPMMLKPQRRTPFGMAGDVPVPGQVQPVALPPSAVAPPAPNLGMGAAPIDIGAPPPMDMSGMQQNLGAVGAMQPEVRAPQSVFGRIGDFFGSDEGRAALLRSGAATINGGIGAGVEAGANYVDQRHQREAATAEQDRRFGLDQRRVDVAQQEADTQTADTASTIRHRATQEGIDIATLEEAIRKNLVGERLTAAQAESLDRYRRATIRLGYVEEGGRNARNAQDNAVALHTHDTPSGSTTYASDSQRYSADEGRAFEAGPQTTTINRDDAGAETGRVTTRSPEYGDVRYDAQGNAFRLDAFSGQPVAVPRVNAARAAPRSGNLLYRRP